MADPVPSLAAHQRHMIEDGGASFTIAYADMAEKGSIELEICKTCHFIRARCEHKNNTWDSKGEHLTCDLCGIDGT